MKTLSLHRNHRGSALLVALILVGILTGMGATSFMVINNKYRAAHQAASWQEALLTSEAGVDTAVNEIRKNLRSYPSQAFPAGTAPGLWRYADSSRSTPNSGYLDPTVAGGVTLTTPLIIRTSEGSTVSYAQVTVDTNAGLFDNATSEPWFRIRSRGFCQVPGSSIPGGESKDLSLRKFDFRVDHITGQALVPDASGALRGQATRTVEAIVKPQLAFRGPLLGVSKIDMTDHNIVVDSYDSRNSNKSTNGKYDAAKRQWNGDIATDGTIINAGSAHIYGTASTNGGDVTNSSNITGNFPNDPNAIRNDFYQDIVAVTAPTVAATAGTPTNINGTTTITASPGDPTQVNVSAINLSGSHTLTIAGAADGSTTYAQIVVSGNISLTGESQIILGPGVKVRVFVKGDVDIAGNGVSNTGASLNFQLYGVDRSANSDGTQNLGSMKIAGNGGYNGTVYAPNYNIDLKGGGNTDSVYGSFVGNIITLTGVQSVHYDEALGTGGLVTGYNIVSWFEDER